MSEKEMVTITVEIEEELLEQARAILAPLGLTPEDALRMFIEFCGDPKNEEAAIAMIKGWLAEDSGEPVQSNCPGEK